MKGKSTLCELLVKEVDLKLINVGQLVVEKGLHDGKDQEWDSYLLNEDKVIEMLFAFPFSSFSHNKSF